MPQFLTRFYPLVTELSRFYNSNSIYDELGVRPYIKTLLEVMGKVFNNPATFSAKEIDSLYNLCQTFCNIIDMENSLEMRSVELEDALPLLEQSEFLVSASLQRQPKAVMSQKSKEGNQDMIEIPHALDEDEVEMVNSNANEPKSRVENIVDSLNLENALKSMNEDLQERGEFLPILFMQSRGKFKNSGFSEEDYVLYEQAQEWASRANQIVIDCIAQAQVENYDDCKKLLEKTNVLVVNASRLLNASDEITRVRYEMQLKNALEDINKDFGEVAKSNRL